MKNETSPASALYAILVMAALILPSAAWSGYAVSTLWSWFVVPLGMPKISIFHAAGLTLVASVMTGIQHVNDEKSVWESVVTFISRGLFIPAMALGFGWLYTLFL